MITPARAVAVALLGLLASTTLTGCRTEYRGPYSDIDGMLWRQVASVEDPFYLSVFHALTPTATEFIAQLPAERWERDDDRLPDLDEPVAVVYDVETSGDVAAFSVFFSSGTREPGPTDAGAPYTGPDSVFTCADWRVTFGPYAVDEAERGGLGYAWEDCPPELVEAMPGTVAFAEPDVFSG